MSSNYELQTMAKHQSCQIGEVFHVLGTSHVMDLLYIAITRDGPVRFGDWQKELHLSPNTLSSRLKLLVDMELLEREAFAEIPPRVEYTITPAARDLRGVFEAIGQWAGKHSLGPGIKA